MIGMDKSWDAVNSLAASLKDYPWYHRTSLTDQVEGYPWRRTIITFFVVWGTGDRPPELPQEWQGYRVEWRQIEKAADCPFGSVKG